MFITPSYNNSVKFGFVFTFSSLLLLACSTKPDKVQPPSSILQKEEMIEILADIHIGQAQGHLGRIPKSAQDSISFLGYLDALALHNLSKDEFETSFAWYSAHPSVYQPMFEKVIEAIKQREPEMTEQRKGLRGTADRKKSVKTSDITDSITSPLIMRMPKKMKKAN